MAVKDYNTSAIAVSTITNDENCEYIEIVCLTNLTTKNTGSVKKKQEKKTLPRSSRTFCVVYYC